VTLNQLKLLYSYLACHTKKKKERYGRDTRVYCDLMSCTTPALYYGPYYTSLKIPIFLVYLFVGNTYYDYDYD